MNFLRYGFQKFSPLLWGTFVFLLLGIFTRFSYLENPKEVVFDEYHFFHFVSQYEEGKYFFDIHPPLGKLVLWANAQMYGLPEFIEEEKQNFLKKEALEKEQKILKTQILEDAKRENASVLDQEKLRELKIQYQANKSEIEYLQTHSGGLNSISIGKEYSDTLNIWGIRSVPAFFGAALVALMFYFAYFLTSSFAISTLIGMFTLFSPAFLVESQYVLMDSMLMFFIVLGTFFVFKYYKNAQWKYFLGVVITSALVISIKWTGLSLIGIAGIIWILVVFQKKASFVTLFSQFFVFWVFVPAFYMGTFAIHFSLLSSSGEGDAFHTPAFKANVKNTPEFKNENIIPKEFFVNNNENVTERLEYKLDNAGNTVLDWENWKYYGKFIELNRQMGERSAAIRDAHPFASRPEDWIKGEKAIYLWNKEGDILSQSEKIEYRKPEGFIPKLWNKYIGGNFEKPLYFQDRFVQQLHLFPNAFLWSALPYSTFLLFILFLCIFASQYFLKNQKENKRFEILEIHEKNNILYVFLFIMILMNILPFVLVERPKFLYHAFEGALFAILGLGVVLTSVSYVIKNTHYENIVLWGITSFITLLLILFFIIELPLIYGFPFHDSMGNVMFQLF